MWKVIIDYDANRPIEEQDAVDARLDGLADAAGEVVESGSGSGFGRRDLDYAFETEAEADRLAQSVQAAYRDRPTLDLSVRAVSLDETFDA